MLIIVSSDLKSDFKGRCGLQNLWCLMSLVIVDTVSYNCYFALHRGIASTEWWRRRTLSVLIKRWHNCRWTKRNSSLRSSVVTLLPRGGKFHYGTSWHRTTTRHFGRQRPFGWPRRVWKYNIKMDLREVIMRIHSARNSLLWRRDWSCWFH